jgi:hypothetical protein
MKFFIPHLAEDPAKAEAEWARYLADSPASPTSKRVYSMTLEKEGSRYVVTVGKRRKVYKQKTGPRGGYIKDADYNTWGSETGTEVSGIVHGGDLIYVWTYGPPFGGWANPSFVGRREVTSIEYFEDNESVAT